MKTKLFVCYTCTGHSPAHICSLVDGEVTGSLPESRLVDSVAHPVESLSS